MTTLLPLHKPRLNWVTQAECRGLNTDIFFSTHPKAIETAKSVCRDCPVQAACLEEAMATEDSRYGIYGGLTPDERSDLARRRRRQRRAA